ncbi:hypothetical protein [Priestia aryabhattai]
MKQLEINDILSTVAEMERHLPKHINLFNLYIKEAINLAIKGKTLENTNDERNYSYDIMLLISKIALVKPLLDGTKEIIYLEVSDMWQEAQISLDKILSVLGVDDIAKESDYDNGIWALQKKKVNTYPDLIELIADEMIILGTKIASLRDTDEDRNFVYDLTLLLKNFSEIKALIKEEKVEVILDMNMWDDAQKSFLKVLEIIDIEDNEKLSNYDHHQWVFRKKVHS